MIKLIKEEGALSNIIIALTITAILTIGIVAAIFYVNIMFDGENLEQNEHMNNAHASKMERGQPIELSYEDYRYLAYNGTAKLLGLSEGYIAQADGSTMAIPEEIKHGEKTYRVVEIGDGAFKDSLKGIKEVKIPKTVENIGLEAFKGNDLEGVIIPSSVKVIGRSAFEDNRIRRVDLPKELVSLSENAFRNNELENIVLPNSLDEIGESTFENNRIKSIDFGNSLLVIRKYAFAGNDLNEINLPNSVKDIRQGAFMDNLIMKVTISESVEIDDTAIDGAFGDAYFFSLGQGGTYIREDKYLYTWSIVG